MIGALAAAGAALGIGGSLLKKKPKIPKYQNEFKSLRNRSEFFERFDLYPNAFERIRMHLNTSEQV